MDKLFCNCKKLNTKKNKRPSFILIGLENSGKTSLINFLSKSEDKENSENKEYNPTFGFNAKAFRYKDINITIFDCGGKKQFRNLWEYYYQNTDGIIFVLDSSNPEKFEESGKELIQMLNNPILEGKPLLIYANKKDKENSVDINEITDYLGLHDINSREWIMIKSSFINGIGLYEGLFWLINTF